MKIKDLLLAEVDGYCPVCGDRSRDLTEHHLRQSTPKVHTYENRLMICRPCHDDHHAGKDPKAEALLSIKRRLIARTLTIPGLNALKEARRRGGVVAAPYLVNHLIEMRLISRKSVLSTHVWKGVEAVGEAFYTITDSGKDLLKKWRF